MHEEGVATKVLDGVEVVLVQTQQSQAALENVSVGKARAAVSTSALTLMRLRYLPTNARPE